MRIGLAQIRPHLGQLERNVHLHIQMIEQAKDQDVDLLVFPELSLTGYHLLDLTYDVARNHLSQKIQKIIQQADGLDLAFGFVEHTQSHQLFNSAIYASQQRCIHLHRKVYLPTYGMFEEGRFFHSGETIRSFQTPFGKFGILICEDAWHLTASYLLAMDEAEMILVLANSPTHTLTQEGISSTQSWSSILTAQAMAHGIYVLYVNRVGNEDGTSFFGGSRIVDPYGKVIQEAPLFEEELLVYDIDLDRVRQARFQMPLLRSEKPHLIIRELQRIQQKQVEGSDEIAKN